MTKNSLNSGSSVLKEQKKERKRRREVMAGSFLILVGFLLIVSFVSYFFNWQSDQSTIDGFFDKNIQSKNILNKIGAITAHFFIYRLFGLSAFILPSLLTYSGFLLFFNLSKEREVIHWIWALCYMTCLMIFLGFYNDSSPLLSGLVGFEINDFFCTYLGSTGLISILVFTIIIILVVQWKLTPEKVIQFFNRLFVREKLIEEIPVENSLNMEVESFTSESIEKSENELSINIDDSDSKIDSSESEESLEMEVEDVIEEESLDDNLSQSLLEKQGFFDPKLELSKYSFPSHDLLKDYGEGTITIDQEELEINKNKIVETLSNYKIGISKIKATVGPTVTLYEIVPEAGIRISKIKNLEDDIALSLSALGIRIIAPIPGKGTIGIEVPNQKPSVVSMRSVITSSKFQKAEMELPLALGKTISNETFVVDLTKMPHLLMAGATGQGKSVGLNAVLTSLLYKKTPC